VTGDWVGLTGPDDAASAEATLPRRSSLERARPEADRDRSAAQCLAANVDLAFIVQAANYLNVRRLEREYAWVLGCAIRPVVVLTKVDLCGELDAVFATATAAAPGCAVVMVNGLSGEGAGALRELIPPGQTAVVVGASGVGKSTIVNRLLAAEVMATGDVRANDQRGRHTTTARYLHPVPGGGALIDTPGLRSVGLISDDGIAAAFSDISALRPGCRFKDCTHTVEPGCAVIGAIADGELDQARLGSYRKLLKEVAYEAAKDDPEARKREARVFKARSKALRLRERLQK
jgi:ribosome biogenesis GTPase